MQTNTMIDFNRNLTDRIIPEKVDGTGSNLTVNNGVPSITNGLAQIINAFSAFKKTAASADDKPDYNGLVSESKNALRDLIVYIQSVTNSSGSNRNLIPTKFSCEMDGIGGLVIGHMFKLPKNILPKGYRGENIGSQLGNAITSIGHSVTNGDWITKIDTLNIVLDDPGGIGFRKLDLQYLKTILVEASTTSTYTLKTPNNNVAVTKPSADDDSIYKAILTGIGAPLTDENLKLLYAWRQAEGGTAAFNPFNTTWSQGYTTTPYNCNDGYPVKNYASKQDGIDATVKTLKQGYYSKIRNGLISNEGAAQISTYIDEFNLWGTRGGVNRALSGNSIAPPSIAKSTTKIATC